MPRFDLTTPHGQRAEQRLMNDRIVWLTTVNAKGAPLPSPVWFVWEDGAILVHSQPNTPKIRAIRASSRVTINFNTGETGDDVVVISGTAEIVKDGERSAISESFRQKYEAGITQLGMTAESFADEYSQLIRIEPIGLRGF